MRVKSLQATASNNNNAPAAVSEEQTTGANGAKESQPAKKRKIQQLKRLLESFPKVKRKHRFDQKAGETNDDAMLGLGFWTASSDYDMASCIDACLAKMALGATAYWLHWQIAICIDKLTQQIHGQIYLFNDISWGGGLRLVARLVINYWSGSGLGWWNLRISKWKRLKRVGRMMEFSTTFRNSVAWACTTLRQRPKC